MNKKQMTEEEIKLVYITPAIENAGWKKSQIRMEAFTNGRIIVRGNKTERGRRKRADYLLIHANMTLAVVEAKDNTKSLGDGMQQAIGYAQMLDAPFAYSSNGDGFIEHDMLTGVEREISLDKFPTEAELWERYRKAKNITTDQEQIVEAPYLYSEKKEPRYYQTVAINRTLEAISKGQRRLLLVMATGVGKTYTAAQIVHTLRDSNTIKKVLYLADRNILIDQTIEKDFKPFKKVMTKVKHRKMDSSYEIYLALYQQLTGEDELEVFKQFKPEFFDLIIVDECHRGSAKANSRWRKILDYFSSAIHLGMTATPKETTDISNSTYFGAPIYTYSLKQGIDDGFLAPYKVMRIGLSTDLEGYRPHAGQFDDYGVEIEDREYGVSDFDKNIIIDERTKMVANKITEYLKMTDRFQKTIIFCERVDHAERMRMALVNENKDLCAQNPKYVMRITGDNDEGKAQLENFTNENEKYPAIVTTSKLLSTGVDCVTCKLIVLDNNLNSMTEFKQIIGRGTRIDENFGKLYFTIMDFRNASRLFADPAFDGEPVVVYEAGENDPPLPDEEMVSQDSDLSENYTEYDEEVETKHIYRVSGVQVTVLSERVQYYDKNGKLITESLITYSRKNILKQFHTLDEFLNKWTGTQKRSVIIEELKEQGVLLSALRDECGQPDLDDFDLICHIAFDQKPLTKSERAKKAKQKAYFEKYSDTAKHVLYAILDKYSESSIEDFEDLDVLKLDEFKQFGTLTKIIKLFGTKEDYLAAITELKRAIYVA